MSSGIIIIDKPIGWTSRDIVNKVSKQLNTKKVGHCGTLDPLASGVLILCVNNGTKLVPYLTNSNKVYEVELTLGIRTSTGDLEGEVIEESNLSVSESDINLAFTNFPRQYLQQVPIYSAVKVGGKKLYEYARNNEEVEIPKRDIEIYSLDILEISGNKIRFTCEVSKGTYIRSLCEDIALSLNTVGVMSALKRIEQGSYTIDEANSLDNFNLIKLNEVKPFLPRYDLSNEEYLKVLNGAKLVNINKVLGNVCCYYNNELIAIYQGNNDILRCVRVIYGNN